MSDQQKNSLGYLIPTCPGCGSPPAAEDVPDICPGCAAYWFDGGIVVHFHLPQGPELQPPPIKQQMATPRWERIPPSQVKKTGRGAIEWTIADGPTQWAKLFGISPSTLKRRFKDGKIRHKELSAKSYQIAVDDLPAKHQDKYRNAKN